MAINVTDEVSSTSGGSQTTAQVFTLPTTVNDGETLLVVSGFNSGIGTVTGPGGIWTSTKYTASAGSDMVVHTAVANSGSLGGTTVNFTIGTARFGAHHAWSIADAGTISLSGTATGSGSDNNPDCPNETPAGGAITRMWFPLAAFGGANATLDAVPSGYANSGITSQNNGNAIFCRKVSSNASENPAAYTVSTDFSTIDWVAGTIAVEESVSSIDASGTPSIPAIEADGDATVLTPVEGSGTPSIPAIEGAGTATVLTPITASGTPSIPAIEAAGTASVTTTVDANGSPSIPAIEGAGTATVITPALITASGAASIPSLIASGTAVIASVEPFQPGRLHIAPFFN